jgi:iron-sulfur cluster repair protein YtfE (RIC family)
MRTSGNGAFQWDIAALAGGLAVGILASRLLPPMVAAASGAMRARFAHDPFERLRQDHREILNILDRMMQARDGDVRRRGTLFLSLKRTLAKHALAEEDVVYPALHGPAGSADAARSLYAEHAEMKIHLYALEQALTSGHAWGVQLPTLRQLIARHIQTEEDVEFPRLASKLDAAASRAAAGQIYREEAMIR